MEIQQTEKKIHNNKIRNFASFECRRLKDSMSFTYLEIYLGLFAAYMGHMN